MDCNNYNGRIFIPKEKSGPMEVVVKSDGAPIKVRKTQEGDKMAYYVSYKPTIAPSIASSTTPPILEIGQSTGVLYRYVVTKGSEEIVSKTINPVKAFTDINNVVEFTVNQGYDSIGIKGIHTLTVKDEMNVSVMKDASVKVQHRYFIGTLERNLTNADIIKDAGKLADSLASAYGSIRTYEIPEVDSHIVWLLPAGENMGIVRDENNFECETINAGFVDITNSYGHTMTYTVIKTKNFYASNNSLKLKF